MQPDKILVVMPSYNALPFLSKAIESILNQTHSNFSFLIINDGSTDGSDSVIRSYSDSDNRIISWNQNRIGPGAAMNLAIEYASANNYCFIARMDADDISLPDRLEKQLDLLQKYPNAAACSANCYYIDSNTEKIIGASTISASPKLIDWEINQGLRGLIQGACLFRVSPLVKIGGYRPQFKKAEEVDLFLRLSDQFNLTNSTDFLYKIRLNPISLSLKDVHENTQYQFYAMDCATKRRNGLREPSFEEFLNSISLWTKLKIWREEKLLNLWRGSFAKFRLGQLMLAFVFDPRRGILRIRRFFLNYYH